MKSIMYALFSVLIIYGINSCSKIDDYKKYVTSDTRYAGKIDTAFVYSGYYRAELLLVRGNDPLVNKARVYWNNRTDSLDVNITGDTTKIVLEDFEEKVYNFEIYTFNNLGNKSIVSNIVGSVYGDDYVSTLRNRRITSIERDKIGSVIINLEPAFLNEVGLQIKYTDDRQGEVTQLIPTTQNTIVIPPSYTENTNFYFKSLYKPDTIPMIDSLSPVFSSVEMPAFEREVEKSKFRKKVLPTDVGDAHGWVMENLWNGTYLSNGFATAVAPPPHWYTIDLGDTVRISRFKMWPASDRIYDRESVKSLELWGSLDPNPNGSWDGWTYLTTATSFKPSGLPMGQLSEEDIAYARAGEEFLVPGGKPAVRYIRVKVLSIWNADWSTMGEFSFWTSDK